MNEGTKNLLAEFIAYLQPEHKRKLISNINTSGKVNTIWQNALKTSKSAILNKEKLLKELAITHSHFDKICSELLQKCYTILVPERGMKLIVFLTQHEAWNKHLYSEINHQLKHLSNTPKAEAYNFLKQCIAIHNNLSYISQNKYIFKKIEVLYLQLSPQIENDKLWIAYKKIYSEINNVFAAATTNEKEEELNKKLNKLKPDFETVSSEVIFEYYWTAIFLKQAAMRFAEVLMLIDEVLLHISSSNKEMTALIRLKRAEVLYHHGVFEESYQEFQTLLKTNKETYPNLGYWYTKYLQISLITGHFETAKWILDYKRKSRGNHFEELIFPRDIISYAKYHILVGEYEKAFYFIRLGFAKNPKSKFFQYETELRMLETAYFYLSGNITYALYLCKKNIAWLHSKGYKSKSSIYPKFYLLLQSIFEMKTLKRNFKKHENEYYDEMLSGSAAVYGRILNLIKK